MLDVDPAMADWLGDRRQMLLDASCHLRGSGILRKVLQRTVGVGPKRRLLVLREHSEDLVESLTPRRIERCHRVAERWEVDMGDPLTVLRLWVGNTLESRRVPQPM